MSRHEYFALPYRGAWTWTTTYVRTYAWVGWQVYCCCGVARGETRRGGCGCACSADARDAMPVARSHQSIPSSRPRQKTATHRRLCFFFNLPYVEPDDRKPHLTSPHQKGNQPSSAGAAAQPDRTAAGSQAHIQPKRPRPNPKRTYVWLHFDASRVRNPLATPTLFAGTMKHEIYIRDF